MSPGDQFMTVYPESNCRIENIFNPRPCNPGPSQVVQYDSSTDDILGGSALGVLIGGGLGWAMGRLIRRWETVDLAQVTVGNGGLGLSVSVRP